MLARANFLQLITCLEPGAWLVTSEHPLCNKPHGNLDRGYGSPVLMALTLLNIGPNQHAHGGLYTHLVLFVYKQ